MQLLTIVSLACLAILADASAIWGHHGGHQDGQLRGEGIAKSQWYKDSREDHIRVDSSIQTHGHGHGQAAIIGPSARATVIGPKDHAVSIVGPSAHATVLSAKHHEISVPAIAYASQIIHHPVHEKHSLPFIHRIKHNEEGQWYENEHKNHKTVATSFQTHGHGHAAIIGSSAYATVIGPKDQGVSVVGATAHATVLNAKHHEVPLPAISYASQYIHHPVDEKHNLPLTHSVKHNGERQWYENEQKNKKFVATSFQTHGHEYAATIGSSSHATVIGPKDHGGVSLIAPSSHATVLSAKHHKISLPAISYASQIIHHPVQEKHSLPLVHSIKHNDDGQWHGEGLSESQWHGDHEVHHGVLATSVKTHDLGHAAIVGPVSKRVVVVGPQDHGAVLIAPSAHGSVVSKKHHESPLIATSHTAQIIQHPVHVPRVVHVTHTAPLVHSHGIGHGKGISIIGPSGKIRSHH